MQDGRAYGGIREKRSELGMGVVGASAQGRSMEERRGEGAAAAVVTVTRHGGVVWHIVASRAAQLELPTSARLRAVPSG
jgi:hypothetical protein